MATGNGTPRLVLNADGTLTMSGLTPGAAVIDVEGTFFTSAT